MGCLPVFLHQKGRDRTMIFKKKQPTVPEVPYDPATQLPILKCSICTGETVAGFKDKKTGKFTEVMLVKGPEDLERFKRMYGVESVGKEY